jgi:putative Holliday junction resolvase
VVGLDLGARRIGVAVSDPSGTVATPHSVLQRSGDHAADHRAVAAVVAEYEADLLVVGLPRSLDGSLGPAAQGALARSTSWPTPCPSRSRPSTSASPP